MDKWIQIELHCDNPKVLKACALAIMNCNVKHEEVREEDDTRIWTEMWDYVPSREIKEVSKLFPDDVITCEYEYELAEYTENHMIEFINGEADDWDINQNDYQITFIPVDEFDDRMGIYSKAIEFFRRLDREETDKNGGSFMNWFPEKVCYEFDYVGVKGTTFKIQATKCRNKIAFKLCEDQIESRYDWPRFCELTLDACGGHLH